MLQARSLALQSWDPLLAFNSAMEKSYSRCSPASSLSVLALLYNNPIIAALMIMPILSEDADVCTGMQDRVRSPSNEDS